MKYPHKNSQNGTQPPQCACPEDSDMLELQRCQLNEEDFEMAVKIVSKVKLIDKTRLTSIKQKVPILNHLFKNMSEFFVTRKSESIKNRKLEKQKRLEMRRKAQMRRQAKQSQLPFEDSSPNISSLPQIIEEHSNPIPEHSQGVRSSLCYICKKEYKEIDGFYHQHCPKCAEFGKMKREQRANLQGLTALVTGARIKIGYEIALKLLRDGAIVYATTRFTKDAYLRYQKESDFQIWKQRLYLIQCDFLAAPQVTVLIRYLKQNVKKLDILINNAAQTLVRPKEFFTFELQNQQKEMILPAQVVEIPNCAFPSIEGQNQLSIKNEGSEAIDLKRTDQFGQPLDLRVKNTWKEKIEDVSLFDCLSTQIINSTVPFHLIGQLKCLMVGPSPSWVINVSSMEGVFYREWKSSYHPQTNMAKASLNMITRTCALEFARQNIYMNSVDTGWVTDENPHPASMNAQERHDFYPPLDCLEGAMRVLDPIYQGVLHKLFPYGKFLKDYKESRY